MFDVKNKRGQALIAPQCVLQFFYCFIGTLPYNFKKITITLFYAELNAESNGI